MGRLHLHTINSLVPSHDILISTTTSTAESPYITISGNLVNEQVPCEGVPLLIGSKSNVHYQSLLPINRHKTRAQVKPHLPDDSIILVVNAKKDEENKELNIPEVSKDKDNEPIVFIYQTEEAVLQFRLLNEKGSYMSTLQNPIQENISTSTTK